MEISVTIDLSQYSDNEVALFLVQGVIDRAEFEQWRSEKRHSITSHPNGIASGL